MTETAAVGVAATRFHNIDLRLKLGKPTVSLGYADKNERLMNEFGLGEFSQPVETFARRPSRLSDREGAHVTPLWAA